MGQSTSSRLTAVTIDRAELGFDLLLLLDFLWSKDRIPPIGKVLLACIVHMAS